MSKWIDLGTLLLQYGLISRNDLDEGMKLQKKAGIKLGHALVKLGKVAMEDIDWVLSKQLDIPFVIVDDLTANVELLEKFKKGFLIENRILPLYETDDHISIVTEDPFNASAIDIIRDTFNKEVNISTGSGSKIEKILKQTFNKPGVPELVNSIRDIVERIKETSFYRFDFLLAGSVSTISVFGFGIFRTVLTLKGHFTNEDVFRAFGELGIPFLYEQAFNHKSRFLAVYPLVNKVSMDNFPVIIGEYGLYISEDIIFTDARVHGVSHIFPVENPITGYPCLFTRCNKYGYEKSVYLIDSAPKIFNDYYVQIYVPKTCTSCNGQGCASCKSLGYEFRKVAGKYSSDSLKEKLKEGQDGKD